MNKTILVTGAAETEFSMIRFKGYKERANQVYEGFTPLRADDIAEAVHYVTTLPGHVNINDLVIMPAAQTNATTIVRYEK